MLTYSEISKSGIFSFKTNLTESQKINKKLATDIEKVFMKNEVFTEKIKTKDYSVFILNHQQDFLKIYDYDWSIIYDYLKKKGNRE